MGDISKVEVDGTLYNIKDAVARKQVEQMETELPSKVESEVESYLSENPPQGGSISESDIVNALAVYFRDNPVKDGEDGVSPTVEVSEIEGGHRITITDATTTEPKVIDILDGVKGDKGDKGVGIQSIEKTSTEGLVDTYTITFTDGNTTIFTITNGKDGSAGSGTITYEQIASAVEDYLSDNPIQKGEDGFSPIVTVSEIAGGHSVSVQTKDTTEVFNVMNGVDGQNGQDGVNGKSAYELAVENGFEGTVEEWLESLKGNDGSNGITEDNVNNLIQSAIGDVIGGEY